MSPASRPPAVDDGSELLGTGTILSVAGQDVEFFTIGQLAAAINRKAVTLRAWEASGVIPRSGYTTKARDPRGKRRLYTRAQCLGIIQLAKTHGLMEAGTKPPLQEFGSQVRALFAELRGR